MSFSFENYVKKKKKEKKEIWVETFMQRKQEENYWI